MKTLVIKAGGTWTGGQRLRRLAVQVRHLHRRGDRVVVVHGGGPAINEVCRRWGLTPSFRQGLRVTDAVTLRVVEMVLSGMINPHVVGALLREGVPALGISGRDLNLVEARRLAALGYVGNPHRVRSDVLEDLLGRGWVCVLSPVCSDGRGGALNVNADAVASAVAEALKADVLVFLTDTTGVLDDNGRVIPRLSLEEAVRLRHRVITDGMVPKVEAAIQALQRGIGEVRIVGPDEPSPLQRGGTVIGSVGGISTSSHG